MRGILGLLNFFVVDDLGFLCPHLHKRKNEAPNGGAGGTGVAVRQPREYARRFADLRGWEKLCQDATSELRN